MRYPELRAELRDFYENTVNARAAAFCTQTVRKLDAAYRDGMSVYAQKALQYRTITQEFTPVLFAHSPFYYEMGTLAAHCDGARDFRGHAHAGGWTYWRNKHLFKTENKALYEKRRVQGEELLYLICGPFNDVSQHFCFNARPILAGGFAAVHARAAAELGRTSDEQEREFLQAVCEGALCMRDIAQKFANEAKRCEKTAKTEEERAHYARIASSAARCPFEAPQSFYEALNTLALCRKALGSLEGVGFSSFGRVDVDLYPFYLRDIERGVLTPDEAYALICQFLITFDLHYDHDMKMVGYADHELENTYTLGGCDANGRPVWNEITEMFLRAAREEEIIYPKIKARFSADSPKAYLDAVNASTVAGTSTALYQNDTASISALLRSGHTLAEARDYIISGCWDMRCVGVEKPDAGNYVNLLKAFEFSLHRRTDKIARVGIPFSLIDGARDFEEVYRITLENLRLLFEERARITREGGGIWSRVDALPLFSSTLCDCIEKHRDFTNGGARYRDDHFLCFGLPNIVDSLLAIKLLCFEGGKYTLDEMLCAVRANWAGYEQLRADAIACPGWGDGSAESCALAARLNADLFALLQQIKGTHGGRIHLGHLTYTEIRFWGEQTLATPDGRYSGDYFSQGLTPSRLKRIDSVSDVTHSLTHLDPSMMGANSVVNIMLPGDRTSLSLCEVFLRVASESALQCLQLNCTSRETLLDAQKHPEKYPHLIVRVCGFSVKFTSLTREWQDEILSRNFYR